MSTLASYWFVPAFINFALAAYLCWKLTTGGLTKKIMDDPRFKGSNAIGGVLAVLLYFGLSLGLGLVSVVGYSLCSVMLLLATIGAITNGAVFAAAWSLLVLIGTPWMLAKAWREFQQK